MLKKIMQVANDQPNLAEEILKKPEKKNIFECFALKDNEIWRAITFVSKC